MALLTIGAGGFVFFDAKLDGADIVKWINPRLMSSLTMRPTGNEEWSVLFTVGAEPHYTLPGCTKTEAENLILFLANAAVPPADRRWR